MNREAVKSSQIKSIGHDPDSKILAVEFHNGNVYHYTGITSEDYQALKSADSLGKHFNANIRGKYSHAKQ